MKTRKIVARLLVVLALALFVGSMVSEFAADPGLPEELRGWKSRNGSNSGAFTLIALLSVLIGLVGYVCAMFVQRWTAFILLAHIVAFVVANAIMGPHVYMGQTQALFLLYMLIVGALIVVLYQNPEPNKSVQTTAMTPPPSTTPLAPLSDL